MNKHRNNVILKNWIEFYPYGLSESSPKSKLSIQTIQLYKGKYYIFY